MPTSRVIIGLDPGIALTGYGIIAEPMSGQELTVLEYGVIRTVAADQPADRLVQVHDQLDQLLKRYQPTIAGCETLFFSKNVKTASIVGQARGVIIFTLAQHHIPIIDITPPQVKQAITGYGLADKKQIQYMTQRLLHLTTVPQPDDAADALAIAIAISTLTLKQ